MPRWGIPDAAGGLFAAYTLSVVTTAVWAGASGTEIDERTFGIAVAAIAGLWCGFLGAVLLAVRRKGSGSVVVDLGVRIERSDAWRGLAAGLVTQLVLIPLLYLPLDVDDVGKDNEQLVDSTHGLALVVLYLLLAVGAPIVEELFFRGFVQRALVRRLGPPAGIAVTAVVFGLTHFDVVAIPGLVLFGVVLGVLVHRTGRLGPAIVAHVAFNAVAVAVYLGT